MGMSESHGESFWQSREGEEEAHDSLKKKKKTLHNVVFLGFVFPFWKERAFFFFTFSKNRKEK